MNWTFSREACFNFEGRVALVTGAGGAIGGAVAALLHRSGCSVALADKVFTAVQTLASDIDPSGGKAFPIAYDALNVSAGDLAVRETVARYGRLDFLVPAAGIYVERPFLEIGDDDWQQVMDINLNAVFRISRAAASVMNAGGSIVHVASLAAHRGSFHHAHYASSKGAILALSRSMARDLAPDIRVNAVSPGVIETPMVNDLLKKAGDAFLAGTPANRFGRAEDVAHAIAFLCSDAASYITGESLHVNGGFLMD